MENEKSKNMKLSAKKERSLMARKVHRTRYAEPSRKRLGSVSLRMQFRLSVREVVGLLRHSEIQRVIPDPDAALYKKYADCNLTKAALAESQGVSEPSLGLLIGGIERDILRQALFLGFLRVTMSDKQNKPLSESDEDGFELGQTREIQDSDLAAELNAVQAEDD
jgi:hypothetical protein